MSEEVSHSVSSYDNCSYYVGWRLRCAHRSSQDSLFPGPVVSLGLFACLIADFLSLLGSVRVGQVQVVLIHCERLVPLLLLGGAERTEHRVPEGEEAGGCHEHDAPVCESRLSGDTGVLSQET